MRNNPGGLLEQAQIRVSDAFLNEAEMSSLPVAVTLKDGEAFNAVEGDLAQGKPIVV